MFGKGARNLLGAASLAEEVTGFQETFKAMATSLSTWHALRRCFVLALLLTPDQQSHSQFLFQKTSLKLLPSGDIRLQEVLVCLFLHSSLLIYLHTNHILSEEDMKLDQTLCIV